MSHFANSRKILRLMSLLLGTMTNTVGDTNTEANNCFNKPAPLLKPALFFSSKDQHGMPAAKALKSPCL